MGKKSTELICISALLVLLLSSIAARAQQPAAGAGGQRPGAASVIKVVGAVRLPASYEARRPVRLHELLALSGGLTESADRTIRIYRGAAGSDPKTIALAELERTGGFDAHTVEAILRSGGKDSPLVQPGDVVYVQAYEMIYITGDVKLPQAVKLSEGLTLREAIAIAGGVARGGTDKIFIYRLGVNETRGILTFRYKDIAAKKADTALRPWDIICVEGKGSIGRSCSGGNIRPAPLKIELPLRVIY